MLGLGGGAGTASSSFLALLSRLPGRVIDLLPLQLWKQRRPERGRDLPKAALWRDCTGLGPWFPILSPGGGQSMWMDKDIGVRGPSSEGPSLLHLSWHKSSVQESCEWIKRLGRGGVSVEVFREGSRGK